MQPTLIRPRALILTAALILLLAGLALVFAFREAILERVILGQLDAMGLPAPRLTVTQANLSQLTFEDLKLGTADEAAVERIVVRYHIFGKDPSPVESVRIEQPRMRIDLASGGPPLGSLQALLGGESESSEDDRGAPALPAIELIDGKVELLTPLGPAEVSVSGQAQSDGEGGLGARLTYDGSGGPARLRGDFEGGLDAEGTMSGRLTIDDGAVTLTPAQGGVAVEIGGLSGELEARLRDGQPEMVEGHLALSDLGLQQARFREADLTLSLTEDGLSARGKVRAQDDKLRAAFRAELRDPFGAAAFGLGLSLAASAEAALFDLVAQPFSRGQGTATLQAAGRLLPASEPGSEVTDGGLQERLVGGQIEGRFAVDLSDLAVPERLNGLAVKAKGDIRLADGAAAVTLAPGAAGEIAAIEMSLLEPLGLPSNLIETLANGLRFGLDAAKPEPAGILVQPAAGLTEITLDGRLTASARQTPGPRLALELREALVTLAEDLLYVDFPDLRLAVAALPLPGLPDSELSLAGSLYGQPDELETNVILRVAADDLRQGDLRLRDVTLRLPLHATLLRGALEAQIVDRGEISIAGLSHASGLRLTKPAKLTLSEGTLLASPPSPEGTGGDRFAHDLRARLGTLALSYSGGEGDPLNVTLRPATLKLIGEREGRGAYRGRLQVSGGGAALPGLEAELKRLNARLDFDASLQSPSLSLNGQLAYQALPPFRLDAKAKKRGKTLSFEAELGAAAGPLAEQGLRPQITGDYDLAQGRATFALAPLRLTFAPGLLQPGDLLPALADLQRVTGSLTAQGDGVWSDGNLAGRGALQVRGLGLKREDITLQGLDLDLALDSLWPPRSLPNQRLTIQRVESALPIETIAASFRLLPGDPAKVDIADLGFTMAGSRFQIRQALIDPAAGRHDLRLELASLDLQSLLGEVDIEGLSGSGRLSGVLPVAVTGETVVIRQGGLQSLGPGVLSYRRDSVGPGGPALPDAPPEEEDAIALFKDPVELTMRALENFHYDHLAIGIDKQADGQAALKIQLEGKNPDLLDGYPFNLNINLTGDVSPVLEALSRGIDLTQELVSRSWRLQR